MTREDKRIVVSHLTAAFLLIAVLVAAPFGWLALTSTSQGVVESRSATSTSELN